METARRIWAWVLSWFRREEDRRIPPPFSGAVRLGGESKPLPSDEDPFTAVIIKEAGVEEKK